MIATGLQRFVPMDILTRGNLGSIKPFAVRAPRRQTMAAVFVSGHSGAAYLPEFLRDVKLEIADLRRSEDAFVDELFAGAPAAGAPLLMAHVPRVFLDPNREPYELDPTMFVEPLPGFANSASHRVLGGLGTIARVVSNGAVIYRRRLPLALALRRIERIHKPFHTTLAGLIARTRERFGVAMIVDCHSMPSVGGPIDQDSGKVRADIVLGDRFGRSAAPAVVATAERELKRLGYRVFRNAPYAGGYITQHYGKPREGVHALQIELNRALYMNEDAVSHGPAFAKVRDDLSQLMATLKAIPLEDLEPLKRAAE